MNKISTLPASVTLPYLLPLQQVNNFSLAISDPTVATEIYDAISLALQLPGKPSPPFVNEGLITSLNGIDMIQTCDYVKLTSATYIRHLLAAHHWETPAANKSELGSRPKEPINPADIKALFSTTGPAKSTPDHTKLELEMGFSYCSLIGEILFAYATTRPDIGYAVTTLAKFATTSAHLHYTHMKDLEKYLHHTIHWGLIYWHPL
jgi:hypothetical protein